MATAKKTTGHKKLTVAEMMLSRFVPVQVGKVWQIHDRNHIPTKRWFHRISSKYRSRVKVYSISKERKRIPVLLPIVSKYVKYRDGKNLRYVSEKQALAAIKGFFG